jgi:predicted RNA binding protein YcfA (HicA-like mRNA interferase family)
MEKLQMEKYSKKVVNVLTELGYKNVGHRLWNHLHSGFIEVPFDSKATDIPGILLKYGNLEAKAELRAWLQIK